jgi:hypothetical protein
VVTRPDIATVEPDGQRQDTPVYDNIVFKSRKSAPGHHTGGEGLSDKKELCKWKRADYSKELPLLKRIVKDPQFVCEKCGRVADKKKRLCKPESLD